MMISRFKLDPSQIPVKQHLERWVEILGKQAKVRSLAAGRWELLGAFEVFRAAEAEIVLGHVSAFEYQRGAEVSEKSAPSIAITFCLEGELVLKSNLDHSAKVCRGQFAITNADMETQVVAQSAVRYVTIYYHASAILTATLLTESNPSVEVPVPSEIWSWIQSTLEYLRTALQRGDALVISTLLKAVEVTADQLARPVLVYRGQVDDDRMLALQAFVDENARNPDLGVGMLCRRFHMSRATLYRHMAHVGGVKRYLQMRRLALCLEEMRKGISRDESYYRALTKAFQFRSLNDFSERYKAQYGIDPMKLLNGDAPSGQGPSRSGSDGLMFNYGPSSPEQN